MRCQIIIRMDNAAFRPVDEEDDKDTAQGNELARVLRGLADEIEMGAEPGLNVRAIDSNGNTVGNLMVVDD